MELISEMLWIPILACCIAVGYLIYLTVTHEDNDNNGYGV